MRTTATRWHSLPETDGTSGPGGIVERSAATAGKPKPKAAPQLTLTERAARGKAARAEVPRSMHAEIARSGDRIAIASYLGKSRTFDQALADFAEVYADQNERDYEALRDAVDAGRIKAETGL
jgi:Uncharacterized protein conserved in bacteria (DUF2252)